MADAIARHPYCRRPHAARASELSWHWSRGGDVAFFRHEGRHAPQRLAVRAAVCKGSGDVPANFEAIVRLSHPNCVQARSIDLSQRETTLRRAKTKAF